MKLHRISALVATGCLVLMMGAYGAGAQQTMPSSGGSPSTGASPNAGSPSSIGTQTPSSAQSGDPTAPTAGNSATDGGGKASMADKRFLKEAMEGSDAEIKLGQIAEQKASSDDVKEFAERMVKDHTNLKDQISPIAGELGVQPSDKLSPKDEALQKKLEGLSGEQFDRAYMSLMVRDNRKDLSVFKKEAAAARDPQVKDAAEQAAPLISEHLQIAQDVARKVGTNSSGKSSNGRAHDKANGGSSGAAIGGGGDTAGHRNDVGSGAGSTTSNPR